MYRPLSREQGAAQLRDNLRTEGMNAAMNGIERARCPYPNTGLRDRTWDVDYAAEWLRGWDKYGALREVV